MAHLLLIAGVIALLSVIYIKTRQQNHRLPLPPGPKGLPILGNIFDLPNPNSAEFEHWLTHKEAYGPISSLKILNTPMILLHSRDAVRHILETHSAKTSGRFQTEFGHKMCEFGEFLFTQHFDTSFRRRRALFHKQMGTKVATAKFDDIGELEAEKLLARILQKPDEVLEHFRTQIVSFILRTTYGYSANSATNNPQDPLVNLIRGVNEVIIKVVVPMSWMVDIFPFLKYLPSFLPGMHFKRYAKEISHHHHKASDVPFSFVKNQMDSGSYRPSFVSRSIEDARTFDGLAVQDAEDIKWSAGAMYIAGGDTVTSSLTTFLLAMTLYPDVQRKAQEEIDRVIGSNRLPRFEDRENLPYLNALVKEVLRWRPVAPLGLPHLAEEDVEYDGYLIPKGSIIIPSIWWICHDPDVYADPETFCPERYLERNEPDPVAVYGFGRRICPGKYLADSTVFITTAKALSVFNIERGVNDGGEGMNPGKTPGIVSFPTELPYKVAPRSESHAELIQRAEKELPLDEDDVSKVHHMF